jgi:hypothetical protein
MILPFFSAPFPMLIWEMCQLKVIDNEGKGETYIILEDILGWPSGDLVLVDADLDCLAGGVLARAQRQIIGEVVLGIVSNLFGANAEVFGLHDER